MHAENSSTASAHSANGTSQHYTTSTTPV